MQVNSHIVKKHFVELRHALNLDKTLLIDIEMCPQFRELHCHVIAEFFSFIAFILSYQLLAYCLSMSFIYPILSKLGFESVAAIAVTATIQRALLYSFTDGLKVEAAATIASHIMIIHAVAVIGSKHRVVLEHDCVPVENKAIH